VVKIRDRYQQPREVRCASHGQRFLPCGRMTRCVPAQALTCRYA
jgi:hypothetical protein